MTTGALPGVTDRNAILTAQRRQKMARSAHAYVRGSTIKFYERLAEQKPRSLPQGPAVWICGDCHSGNLGPLANTAGEVEIQIRDLDQSVVGNPAHDLIRLALSLAMAARGSDLPGITTAQILEQMIDGYSRSLAPSGPELADRPTTIRLAMKSAIRRTWRHLAEERIKDSRPKIPLGRAFWPLEDRERDAIDELFKQDDVRKLATALRDRKDTAAVEVLDAAYWVKGCSSLGRLRLAIILGIGKRSKRSLCLMDVKEATDAVAPPCRPAVMPKCNAERVVEGAKHLAPYLGERMLATRLLGRPVFLRELLPQDLKLEIDYLDRDEAIETGRYLASIVARAHGRQMDASTRRAWQKELRRNRSKSLDAPSWLWSSVVSLIASHEAAYLDHCRRVSADG
jgi:uncharacterized protein (DUF2252 family)